jgi:uncharacterized Zn finger protein
MAKEHACPKCGASCPAEGHETIPHLLTVKCGECGDANVTVEKAPEKEEAAEASEGDEKPSKWKGRGGKR